MLCVVFLFIFLLRSYAQVVWDYDDGTDDSCKTPSRETGSCILIFECKPMADILNKAPRPLPPQIEKLLKEYRCGFEGATPKICCPNGPIHLHQNIGEKDEFPDVSKHKNIKLLPKNCGDLNTDDKIINGEKTDLFEFPWMALLSYQTKNGPQFKCGGSIINEKHILTAAHCLTNLKTPLLGVRVGEHDLRTIKDCKIDKWEGEICAPPYQDLGIERVIIHNQYNPKTFTNDIGLLKVTPIDLTRENSRPVCLPLGEARNYNFTDRNAVVSGWGVTEKGIPSPELLKVSLPIVSLENCQQAYASAATIDKRQLCAGGKSNKDSCAGDSGGPLHVTATLHGDVRLIQQGVVSFGPSRCGQVPIPGVYTRVAAFMDWILDNMEP